MNIRFRKIILFILMLQLLKKKIKYDENFLIKNSINFISILYYSIRIQPNCFSYNFCMILNIQKSSSRDRDRRFKDDFRKPLRSVVQKVSRDLHTEKTFSHGDSTLCDSVWGWTSTRMTGIKIDPTRVRNCFCACSCLPVRLRDVKRLK